MFPWRIYSRHGHFQVISVISLKAAWGEMCPSGSYAPVQTGSSTTLTLRIDSYWAQESILQQGASQTLSSQILPIMYIYGERHPSVTTDTADIKRLQEAFLNPPARINFTLFCTPTCSWYPPTVPHSVCHVLVYFFLSYKTGSFLREQGAMCFLFVHLFISHRV